MRGAIHLSFILAICCLLAAAPAADEVPAPASASKPAAPKYPNWNIGQKVECKWGGLWIEGTIKNKGNGWYLMDYHSHGSDLEWVEPWRLRAVGSTEDNIPYAESNGRLFKAAPPPMKRPADAPPAERARMHADIRTSFFIGDLLGLSEVNKPE